MNPTPETESIMMTKSYSFALEIIQTYNRLVSEKKEYVHSKQMLRSGTSIGANVNEAVSAQSKRDFVHKMSISLKEAKETLYWLRLLHDSAYLEQPVFDILSSACNELIKILSSIILATKEKYFKSAIEQKFAPANTQLIILNS